MLTAHWTVVSMSTAARNSQFRVDRCVRAVIGQACVGDRKCFVITVACDFAVEYCDIFVKSIIYIKLETRER